jgi:thermitase
LVLQVAPNAVIIPLRVLNKDGSGDLDNVIAAIDFAIKNGAQIINISLGADEYADALRQMIVYARSQQVYIVASAGNENRVDNATFPAKMANWWEGKGFLFAVGSLRNDDAISSFSNTGWDVSFFAPGENLTSFAPNNRTLSVVCCPFGDRCIGFGIRRVE